MLPSLSKRSFWTLNRLASRRARRTTDESWGYNKMNLPDFCPALGIRDLIRLHSGPVTVITISTSYMKMIMYSLENITNVTDATRRTILHTKTQSSFIPESSVSTRFVKTTTATLKMRAVASSEIFNTFTAKTNTISGQQQKLI